MTAKLQIVANEINKILDQKTKGYYFVSPGKRALIWFRRYEAEFIFKGNMGAGYSISRTEARRSLYGFELDLDEILAAHGLK